MRQLVLFTANHPFTFNGGESMFVAPELPHLVQAFGALRVVPLIDLGDIKPLPPEVMLDRSLALRWRRQRWRHYLCAPGWPGFWPELVRGARRGGWIGAARVWRWAAVARTTWAWMRCTLDPTLPSLLYTYWRGGQTLAAARWTQLHTGCSAVTRVHRYELYDEAFSPPFQPWTSVYEHLNGILPISQDGIDYLRRRNVDAGRLHLARLGVRAVRKRAMPSTDGVAHVVSCGNLVPVKRVPLCARALVALAERHPGRRFVWTLFGDGPERGAVRAVLERAPPNLVVTLAGSTPNEEVLSHYATHPVDLFILLSSSEGLPVALQEALAAGVPVLATDVGGVREAVDPGGENGVLLPCDASLEAIVSALEALLIDAGSQHSIARRDAAWRRWALDFDADRNHRALARMLAEIPEG